MAWAIGLKISAVDGEDALDALPFGDAHQRREGVLAHLMVLILGLGKRHERPGINKDQRRRAARSARTLRNFSPVRVDKPVGPH